jgi:hypothetical protein
LLVFGAESGSLEQHERIFKQLCLKALGRQAAELRRHLSSGHLPPSNFDFLLTVFLYETIVFVRVVGAASQFSVRK